MKHLFSQRAMVKFAMVAIVCCLGCIDDEELISKSETTPRQSIPTSGFSLWTTCGSNAYVSGSNIIVPIGTGCSTKYNAAQARNAIYGSNWACNAALYGGSGAYSGA